jgi:hypothetical protein
MSVTYPAAEKAEISDKSCPSVDTNEIDLTTYQEITGFHVCTILRLSDRGSPQMQVQVQELPFFGPPPWNGMGGMFSPDEAESGIDCCSTCLSV